MKITKRRKRGSATLRLAYDIFNKLRTLSGASSGLFNGWSGFVMTIS
jgi:hypothetical protein